MINLILNIVFLTFVIVYVINKSGLLIDISRFIYVKINKKEWMGQQISLKPFTCATCMVFHCVWIYLLINIGNIFFAFFVASLFASFGVLIIDKLYDKIIHKINKIIN